MNHLAFSAAKKRRESGRCRQKDVMNKHIFKLLNWVWICGTIQWQLLWKVTGRGYFSQHVVWNQLDDIGLPVIIADCCETSLKDNAWRLIMSVRVTQSSWHIVHIETERSIGADTWVLLEVRAAPWWRWDDGVWEKAWCSCRFRSAASFSRFKVSKRGKIFKRNKNSRLC